MFEIEFDLSDLNDKAARLVRELAIEGTIAASEAAEASLAHLRSGAYWTNHSGDVARSFHVVAGPSQASVESDSKIAGWLDEGTDPHPIVASNARALAFYWPRIGGWFFGKSVNHPGTKALHFVELEAERMGAPFAALMDGAAARAVANAGLG